MRLRRKRNMRIAIIGSREYENRNKIKNTIFELKKRIGDELLIVSGGAKDGADKYAKKYALELGCKYMEFNPAHTVHNLYSACNENFYSKPYSPKNFFVRNTMMAKYVDRIIAFIPNNTKANGSHHTLNEAKKYRKKCVIID